MPRPKCSSTGCLGVPTGGDSDGTEGGPKARGAHAGREDIRRERLAARYFFAGGGGKFFNIFATALSRFFCCFSGFAFASIVLLALPRHTSALPLDEYMSTASCPT